jgi:hypothetical protein
LQPAAAARGRRSRTPPRRSPRVWKDRSRPVCPGADAASLMPALCAHGPDGCHAGGGPAPGATAGRRKSLPCRRAVHAPPGAPTVGCDPPRAPRSPAVFGAPPRSATSPSPVSACRGSPARRRVRWCPAASDPPPSKTERIRLRRAATSARCLQRNGDLLGIGVPTDDLGDRSSRCLGSITTPPTNRRRLRLVDPPRIPMHRADGQDRGMPAGRVTTQLAHRWADPRDPRGRPETPGGSPHRLE